MTKDEGIVWSNCAKIKRYLTSMGIVYTIMKTKFKDRVA